MPYKNECASAGSAEINDTTQKRRNNGRFCEVSLNEIMRGSGDCPRTHSSLGWEHVPCVEWLG
jgi:hypothetical protein